MQVKLVQAAEAGMTGIRITPIRIVEFVAWCAERDEDPRQARAGSLPTWPAADLAS